MKQLVTLLVAALLLLFGLSAAGAADDLGRGPSPTGMASEAGDGGGVFVKAGIRTGKGGTDGGGGGDGNPKAPAPPPPPPPPPVKVNS